MADVTIDGNTGYLMTVEEFNNACKSGVFIDYDGFGDVVRDGEIITPGRPVFPRWVKPSTRWSIPPDATHVLWYDR